MNEYYNQGFKKWLRIVLISFVLFASIIGGLIIIRPLTTTVIKNNKTLVIKALGEKSEESFGTDIRIKGILINNSYYLDLDTFQLSDNWSYFADEDLLVCYGSKETSSIEIELKDVYSVKMNVIKANGGGVLDISINNFSKRINLYKDVEWEETQIMIYDNPLIYPESNVIFLLFVFIISFCSTYIFFVINKNNNSVQRYYNNGLICFVTLIIAVGLTFVCELILRKNFLQTLKWISLEYSNWIQECLFTWIVLNTLIWLLKKVYLGIVLQGILFIGISIANVFKLQHRGTPITPWDFQLISVTLSVVSDFEFKFTYTMILAIICLAFVVVICFLKKFEWNGKFKQRILPFMLSFLTLGFYINTTYIHKDIGVNLYKLDEFYLENGISNSFLYLCKYLKTIEEPDNYSKDALKNKVINSDNNLENIKPNILVLEYK